MARRRYCLTLDLASDPELIVEYERCHQRIWPEIAKSIKDAGIENMEIYRLGTRMFMCKETGAYSRGTGGVAESRGGYWYARR
jgi:L-rhamnose mutarotase